MPEDISHIPGNDKYFFADDDCISCGLCTKVCPCHNIELKDGKPVFKHQCSQCMSCIVFCPKQALNAPVNKPKTKKRKKYHNPYISAKDIMKEKIYFE